MIPAVERIGVGGNSLRLGATSGQLTGISAATARTYSRRESCTTFPAD
ncbi:MAG: hypothetical protein ACLS5S_03910 [Faecalibacterium sp.]